ncbi:MAG: hypothetical protein ACFNUS_01210 [Candidatus Saccharimonas sp.]
MATAIAIAIWLVNTAVAAVAIVMLSAIMRGAGATWMPEISFWQAIMLRLIFKSLLWDALKVTPRD